MPYQTPASPARRRLGQELRKLREASGLTLEEVALEFGCHLTKINRIELARRACTAEDLRKLVEIYDVAENRRPDLERLMREGRSREKPWWTDYADVLSSAYTELITNEAAASIAKVYQPNTVPGLLQTDAYARAVISIGLNDYGGDQITSLTEVRAHRQRLLTQEEPLEYFAVVTEGALRAVVGGPNVMHDQLKHLTQAVALPNVKLHVIPFSAGAATTQNSGVTLFQFPDRDEPEIAFLEVIGATHAHETEREIRRYHRLFEYLTSVSASQEDSLALIAQAMKELE